MEDPTTLGLNLTFFGTLGLALLMSIGLGFLMVVTLVLAGVAKLVWIILLAMVGIFPKRDAVPVVHLPPRPRRAPVPPSDSEEPTSADDGLLGAGPSVPREPRPGFAGTTKLLWSASWSAVRNVPWKSLVNPRTWPKPAQIKDGIAATATTQAKEHPFVVAIKQDPPVLNSQWAAAVAEADARAAARDAERAGEASASDPEPPASEEPAEGNVAESSGTGAPVREHRGEPHGGKPVSSGRVTASAGSRPRA
ncbi:hypothetical protein [Arthrobacter bambusae]|uniref:Uncharacterized protein n=2 Tax=Arthrobacter TaxID=1663 RepID=A0AAW8DJX7_9MICC|nr:hypothetical protein [Arthrobacter bambusae]MDP9906960.1 hypothetical protein [Arthrobacter bambusae]MDQ0130721.1 hypothetical protein [Arthrobacter bambusae]MDQ0182110.1 hypothetical protein [Arthrobacter bambusae]